MTPEEITACIGDLSGFDLETVTAHLEWLEDEGHLARIIEAATEGERPGNPCGE